MADVWKRDKINARGNALNKFAKMYVRTERCEKRFETAH